ncbi:hypothetical protein scyTo_0019691, partial [Scyliorhinus torazame]|nr:hypothetical protein [Scyliorhinus torazame]
NLQRLESTMSAVLLEEDQAAFMSLKAAATGNEQVVAFLQSALKQNRLLSMFPRQEKWQICILQQSYNQISKLNNVKR